MQKINVFSVEETKIPNAPRQGKELSKMPTKGNYYFLVKLYDSTGNFIMAAHGNDLLTAKKTLVNDFIASRYSTNALKEYIDELKQYAETA